jgi:hypothetical protein
MIRNIHPGLPEEIKAHVIEVIAIFNIRHFKDGKTAFYPEFKRNFVYLKRKEYDMLSPIARLTFTGKPDKWDFAIYKYSIDGYDPKEDMFPGIKHLNGTIEGALKAGLEAYPLDF